ncbi:MAG: MFS transporter [Theionarchaea archaeon]|nr:MFS transporter [Theionarchaea archaeon]
MDIKKSALLVATVGSFLTPFMSSSVNIALPSIGREFSIDAVILSWVPTIYLLSAAMFLVPFGRIGDIYGRKKVFTYGIYIYTLSSFLVALSPSILFLLFFRILQGVGSAMIFGTAVAILTSVFPLQERGKVIGINVASVYSGLSLGPSLSGLLTQYWGWRSIFLINVPFGIVVAILIHLRLPGEWAGSPGEKCDIPGSIIYGLALVITMFGISLLPSRTAFLILSIGLLTGLLFIVWETRTHAPVLNMNLFKRNITFTFSNLAALINYSATHATGFLMSLYLQYIRELAPQEAGLVLVCQPGAMVIVSPFAGRLSDKIEPRIVASFGLILTALALFSFTLLEETTPLFFVIARLALLGTGLSFFSSPNTNAIMSSVDKRFYGVASAMVGTMRLMGQMVSMGMATIMIAVYVGKVEIIPGYYGVFLESVHAIFGVFVVLSIVGILASLTRGKMR